VLRGNTSLTLSTDRTAEEYRQALEKVHRSAETMSRLVDQLLLLSKADTEQSLFEPEMVTIADVVDSALESFSPEESSRVRTDIPVSLRTSGSFSLLQRVIENLISNSLSYADQNLPIFISACARSQEICTITVQDGGKGIKPDELPRIRERFYRSDVARSIRSGSGLGLAICDSTIKAHHGTMQIHSEPGNGTAVTIELPLYQ
jgi:signal transduction histidine kinase